MSDRLTQAWQERARLHAEGAKLWAEGAKLHAEGDKLWAECAKLYAEGQLVWLNAVLAECGNVTVVWDGDTCTLGTEPPQTFAR
jgi:hypothetical protein